MVQFKFNPEKDITPLDGKVCFVTGGTAGIGKQVICELVKHNPAQIYFTGRNTKAAAALVEEVKATNTLTSLTFIEADFTSLASVQNAAREFLAKSDRLDILICNAGVLGVPAGVSKDGYESHMAINHLSHALLIQCLLQTLLKTQSTVNADTRIVSLTSAAYQMHPTGGMDFKTLKSSQDYWSWIGPTRGMARWQRYGASKLANLLYAGELSRRQPSLKSVAVYPGVVSTAMIADMGVRNMLFLRLTSGNKILAPEQGALNALWAATTKDPLQNGGYYEPVGVITKPGREGGNKKLASELWEWTDEQIKPFLL